MSDDDERADAMSEEDRCNLWGDGDDPDGVLHHLVSSDDADRLMAGGVDVADDGALANVAGVLGALREPARASEFDGTSQLLAQMVEVVHNGRSVTSLSLRSKPMFARFTGKVAVLTAASFIFAGAAAAASGNLPDVVQRRVAHTVSHIGVDLPDPDDEPKTTTSTSAAPGLTADTSDVTGEANETPVGPDAGGAAKHGLCTAYAAGTSNGHKLEAVAFRNLAAAAKAVGQDVATFCASTASTTSASTTTEVTTTTMARDATSTTEDHPKPTRVSTPPTSHQDNDTDEDDDDSSSPGNSGNTPAVSAPGHNKDNGKPSTPDHGSTPSSTLVDQADQSNNPGNSGNTPAVSAPGHNKDRGKP